ncbi:MAG: hypothetical protein JNK14_12745 [Chitinophagaceae bacterium]|nr:hypothetical protein [Chitinophagaceae bacterium]
MTSIIIGISSGLLTILVIGLLKGLDKKTMYGLVLTGIGFLYVGFAWTDTRALVLNAIQSIFFLFCAYYGIKRSSWFLAAGYFLHGTWDIVYHLLPGSDLIPPHYDLFCLSIDFTIGLYLAGISYRGNKKPIPAITGTNKQ